MNKQNWNKGVKERQRHADYIAKGNRNNSAVPLVNVPAWQDLSEFWLPVSIGTGLIRFANSLVSTND